MARPLRSLNLNRKKLLKYPNLRFRLLYNYPRLSERSILRGQVQRLQMGFVATTRPRRNLVMHQHTISLSSPLNVDTVIPAKVSFFNSSHGLLR